MLRRDFGKKDDGEIDFRGLGPFLPYKRIGDILKRRKYVIIKVDPDVRVLVEKWSVNNGYYVYPESNDTLVISTRPRGSGGPGASVVSPGKAVNEQPVLVIDYDGWKAELAREIANTANALRIVLEAPLICRGSIRSNACRSALSLRKRLFIRASLSDADYFLVAVEGRVIAAAQLGAPLSPSQAEELLNQLFDEDVLVTVYDIS